MTFGSLFTGIGGIDLGLERSGMQCAFQVEIDNYARRVLEKHWPNVRRWDDVRTFPPEPAADWRVDLIAGGFPCQDLSFAGKRAGIDGPQSGLWAEFGRIIGILRPRFVLVENVAAILSGGLGRVLGDLSALGYDAEWDCLPAGAFGAPHRRDRFFLLAYPAQKSACQEARNFASLGRRPGPLVLSRQAALDAPVMRTDWWAVEPDLERVVYGVPRAMDRIKGLGNAVVPQVSEWLGRRILDYEHSLQQRRD